MVLLTPKNSEHVLKFVGEERNEVGLCSVGNVLGYPPDGQGQGHLKEGAEGSLRFLKAVLSVVL